MELIKVLKVYELRTSIEGEVIVHSKSRVENC